VSGSENAGIVDVRLRHAGVHPVYDITIRIVGFAKSDEDRYRNLDRLDPNHAILNFERWQLPKDLDEQNYNIFVSARNAGVFQQV
jgi:hypothetical protein